MQVGIAACQMARVLGLTVYGTAGTDAGMKLALDNGAHKVFNHRDDGYQRTIMVGILVLALYSHVHIFTIGRLFGM